MTFLLRLFIRVWHPLWYVTTQKIKHNLCLNKPRASVLLKRYLSICAIQWPKFKTNFIQLFRTIVPAINKKRGSISKNL